MFFFLSKSNLAVCCCCRRRQSSLCVCVCVSAPPSSSLSAKQKQQKTQPPSSFLLPRSFVHTLRIYLLSCSYRPNTISCSLYAKKKNVSSFWVSHRHHLQQQQQQHHHHKHGNKRFFWGVDKKKSGTRAVGRKGPWWTLFWNVLLSENGQS